jgi:DNA-binding beta-propeller fold protein YncE
VSFYNDSGVKVYMLDKDNDITSKEENNIKIIEGFYHPFSINFDIEGNVYVTELNSTVSKFDKNFSFIASLSEEGWSQKYYGTNILGRLPHSIDFDDEGNFYIADYYENCIKKFSNNGSYITSFTEGIKGPATAYFGPDGILYIADYDADAIVKYDKNGKYHGDIKNSFNKPHSAIFDSDENMYVVDTWNHRIVKYDANGKIVGILGEKKDGFLTDGWEKDVIIGKSKFEGGFNAPVALDFDNSSNLYVSEYGNNRVQCFSYNGTFLFSISGFNNPYDLKIHNDKLYICDTKNNVIKIYDLDSLH